MPVLPESRVEKIEFFEQHNPIWTTNAANIGLTAAEVTALQALTTAARSAFNAQQTAKNAAKAATQNFYNAVSAMQSNGSGLIAKIKTYAETKNDPNAYVLAQIPAPAAPTPAGPPETPTDLTAQMNSDGTMNIAWKGSLAQRQFYSVWRQLPSQSFPQQIGAVAAKDFMDVTVPRGLDSVIYTVRAHRDALSSLPTEALTVYFGAVPGGGGFAARVNGEIIGVMSPEEFEKQNTTERAAA